MAEDIRRIWLLVLSGFKDPGPIVSGRFASAYPSGSDKHVTCGPTQCVCLARSRAAIRDLRKRTSSTGPSYAEQTPRVLCQPLRRSVSLRRGKGGEIKLPSVLQVWGFASTRRTARNSSGVRRAVLYSP